MYHVHEVDSCEDRAQPVCVNVCVDGVDVSMQVDTGASCSVMSSDKFVSLYGETGLSKLGRRPDLRVNRHADHECRSSMEGPH